MEWKTTTQITRQPCFLCDGKGRLDLFYEDQMFSPIAVAIAKCPACDGHGFIIWAEIKVEGKKNVLE